MGGERYSIMAVKYLDSKRIRGSSVGSATATFESDFTSTTGWTQNSTNISISTGNDRVDYDTTSSGSSTSTLVYDLGTSNISETAWVLRGKSVITNYTVGGDGSSCHLFVGLSDEDHTSAFDNNQDSISFAIGAGTNDDNSMKLVTAIDQADYFQARREEQIKSSHYFCRVRSNEYNWSQNPTYFQGDNAELTNTTFIQDPKSYITTVGLYNNNNELLAVAKLSQPLLKSRDREAVIKVRLDF